jgi:hypothetical protein
MRGGELLNFVGGCGRDDAWTSEVVEAGKRTAQQISPLEPAGCGNDYGHRTPYRWALVGNQSMHPGGRYASRFGRYLPRNRSCQGAGMAIEDAVVLADCLCASDPKTGLEYTSLRKPRTDAVIA